jgi:hypothetical protein
MKTLDRLLPGLPLALLLPLLLLGCRLGNGPDTLVVGLHQSIGAVNPLTPAGRPSLALQRLQLPALIEYLGRDHNGLRRDNRYRLSLVDTLPGSIQWHYKRRGGVFSKFILRQAQWRDPDSGDIYPITAHDVKATLARIDQAHQAAWLARQRGRLRLTPFLSFVAQAIDSVEVDPRDERVLYLRFADHVLGPNRMHALTFRILPRRLLESLSDERDVAISATPYTWVNRHESGMEPGVPRPADAVPLFHRQTDGDLVEEIAFQTRQDLRSYKLQLESGVYGLAFGLPQKPGKNLEVPEHMAWKAYDSTDIWAFVFNCKRVSRDRRRALRAILSSPEGNARFAELVAQTYPNTGRDRLRRGIFPDALTRRYPRLQQAIERQAASSTVPVAKAARLLAGSRFRFVYGYGMGDQFEPDIIAQTVKGILGEHGVEVDEERLEQRDFVEALAGGDQFDLALYKFGGASRLPQDFDPARILPMRESPDGQGGFRVEADASNFFHFADAELYEAMLELRHYPGGDGRGGIDPVQVQKRQEAIVAIDRIVRQEAIGLFLFSPSYYWFYDRRLEVSFDENSIFGGHSLPRQGSQ